MSDRALSFAASTLYRLAHALYDLARRIDRYTYGVPWRDAK